MNPFRKSKKKEKQLPSLYDDYEVLLNDMPNYEEFKKKYTLCAIPLKHQYDLFVLCHLHKDELRKF